MQLDRVHRPERAGQPPSRIKSGRVRQSGPPVQGGNGGNPRCFQIQGGPPGTSCTERVRKHLNQASGKTAVPISRAFATEPSPFAMACCWPVRALCTAHGPPPQTRGGQVGVTNRRGDLVALESRPAGSALRTSPPSTARSRSHKGRATAFRIRRIDPWALHPTRSRLRYIAPCIRGRGRPSRRQRPVTVASYRHPAGAVEWQQSGLGHSESGDRSDGWAHSFHSHKASKARPR